ncbi:MAG: alpha/beta hydrolase [Proteobacteria bacterium]|nr:alpha/beta hydrolase [Pseudomonadota bacterium]
MVDIPVVRWLPALCAVLAALASATAGAAQERISLQTRAGTDGPRVTLDYLLARPDARTPVAVLVAPWRGSVALDLHKRTLPVQFGSAEMLAMRSMALFERAGLAVALVDNPSDQPVLPFAFRRDTRHVTDLSAVVQDLRQRFPGVPVLLAGHNIAGTSALHAAARLGKAIDGVVLIGADYNNLRTFDFNQVSARALMLHHADDACSLSPLVEAREIAAAHRFTLAVFEGGSDVEPGGPCGNLARHGLGGLEAQAVDTLVAWLEGRPSPLPAVERTGLNEEVLFIPARSLTRPRLEATLYRPDGPGPFPLVVINHGRSPDASSIRQFQRRERYVAQARAFVRHGFAVAVPMRSGNGRSGGSMPQLSCEIERHGLADAVDILDTIEFIARRPDIDRSRLLLVGQSAGGLASQALASRAPEGLRGVVNFAGVLRLTGSTTQTCWFDGVIRAFAGYQKTTTVPSLWIYTSNDSYFEGAPDRVIEMDTAVRKAGGTQRLVLLPPFGNDGHALFGSDAAVGLWLPTVETFLKELGLVPGR